MAVAVLAMLTVWPVHARRDDWQSGAENRRADYVFMEAQRRKAVGDNDAYFEMVDRAYKLAPEDTYVGAELGLHYILLDRGKEDNLAGRGLELMRRHFDGKPEDYHSALIYGTMCERAGLRDESLRVWDKLHSLNPTKVDISLRLVDALAARPLDSIAQRRVIALLDTLQKSEGESLQITARKVRSRFSLRDTVGAFDDAMRFVKATPRSAESRVYAADLYMMTGDRDKALQFYNQACEVDPSSGLAFYKRAEFYNQIGDSVAYDREVFEALQLPDLELDTKLEILTGYVKELYADSIQQPRIDKLFGSLIDTYPHEASVHDLYSSYLAAIDNYAQAAEQQEYVVDSDPGNLARWTNLVGLYLTVPDYSKALNAARRAMARFPEEGKLCYLAGHATLLGGDPDSARVLVKRSLELIPSTEVVVLSQALTTLGDIEQNAGNVAEAYDAYERAITTDPSNDMAMNNYAYFLACSGGDLEKAVKLSKRSLELDPENTSSLDTYAWIMFKKGDYKEAKMFIDRALEETAAERVSAELLQHAGDIYYMCGEPEDALDFWKQAAKLDPDDKLLQRKISNKAYYFK